MKKKLIKVVIERSKWLRGTGDGTLLDDEGKMCCLGFLGKVCGYTDKDINRKGTPADLNTKSFANNKWPESLLDNGINTLVCDELVNINDSKKISDKMREYKLKIEGKHAGIDFVFVD